MNVTVLVDAHNLLHALMGEIDGFPKGIGDQRKATANLLSIYATQRKRQVIAFVDGGTGPEGEASMTRPMVRAIFTRDEGEADAAIADYLVAFAGKRRFLVISSDQQVASHARMTGADTQSSQAFATTLAKLSGQSSAPVGPIMRSQHDAPPNDKEALRRGDLGEIEAAMLAEVGDLQALAREVLRDADKLNKKRRR